MGRSLLWRIVSFKSTDLNQVVRCLETRSRGRLEFDQSAISIISMWLQLRERDGFGVWKRSFLPRVLKDHLRSSSCTWFPNRARWYCSRYSDFESEYFPERSEIYPATFKPCSSCAGLLPQPPIPPIPRCDRLCISKIVVNNDDHHFRYEESNNIWDRGGRDDIQVDEDDDYEWTNAWMSRWQRADARVEERIHSLLRRVVHTATEPWKIIITIWAIKSNIKTRGDDETEISTRILSERDNNNNIKNNNRNLASETNWTSDMLNAYIVIMKG